MNTKKHLLPGRPPRSSGSGKHDEYTGSRPWGITALCVFLLALALLPAAVSADDWVGGLPLTTVQTGTVTGDLYIAGNPPSSQFLSTVDRTFTLPAEAVEASGRIKWARLYVSVYCGHMQNANAITYTTNVDWNNDGIYDSTWTETGSEVFGYMQGGDYGPGNDNSEFTGHGTEEPYLMINDHTTRVTSDYFSWYDVKDLIQAGEPTIKVNVNGGGADGRIKIVTLVVAYDDPTSTIETTYWVNEGHDVCSYYTEDNEGTVAVGATTFGTSGIATTDITSATLIADYMASNNGYYGFPTAENDFDASAKTGGFTNIGLDRVPDAQGPYSGQDSWTVTSSVLGESSVTFAYSRYLPGTGTSSFYKIPLAFLVVKSPAPVSAPVAAFAASTTSGTAPLTVTFTDQSTNTPTNWAWTFGDGSTSTDQNPVHEYTAAGTYTVTLTATNSGGHDDEVKTDYITVTNPAPLPVAAFSATPTSGAAPLTVQFTDASTSSAGGSEERVTNGGFEIGDATGWIITGTGWEVIPGGRTTGQYVAVTTMPNTYLSQDIDLTDVDELTFWWSYSDDTQSGIGPELHVKIDETDAFSSGGSDSAEWTSVSIDTSSYTGTHTVSWYFAETAAEGSYTYVDDISAVSTTGGITSWAWTFGDGGTSDQQNPSHEYTAAETYDVTLTVTDANGSDDETKTGYIEVTSASQINLMFTGADGSATVSAYPAYVFAREPNTVQVKTIKNSGTETATDIVVALYASDVSSTVPVATTTIASLAGGATASTVSIIDPTVRDLAGTAVTYTAKLDPDNVIAETDETDNTRTSSTFTVRYNGYKGKRYWEGGSDITTQHIFDLNGDMIYSTQSSSAYKGVGWTTRTETWSATDLQVPSSATVQKVYLYVTYNWDTTSGGAPSIATTFNGNTIDLGTPYTDQSNFGYYANYKYGLFPAIDVTSLFVNGGENTLVMTPNSGNSNALYPSSLVVVYSDASATRKQIFINEECDELLLGESSYATTLDEVIAYAPFTGMTIDTANVQSATLHSFAGSAGSNEGNLIFNGATVATLAWQGSSSTASAQSFDVKSYLTAENNVAGIQGTSSGGMDALQQILVVEYTPTVVAPVADFTGTPTSGTAPLTVTFTDASANTPTEWLWNFGDGLTSTDQNPVHEYTAAGTYTVTLTATNSAGSDDETKTDYITVSAGVIALPGFTDLPTDPDSDGLYEDVTGNGITDFPDVQTYFKQMDWIAVNEPIALFDYSGSGTIDFPDIQLLFKEI